MAHHKQNNSSFCFVCGVENRHGLKAKFYTVGADQLVAVFQAEEHLQSYPGVLHGGISAAILDETIGRTILRSDNQVWGVTVELSMRYRKPLPLGETLYARARITENNSRLFTGTGEILLPDGTVAVSATGKYMKLPLERIAEPEFEDQWFFVDDGDSEVVIPDYVLA